MKKGGNQKKWLFQSEINQKSGKNGFLSGGHFLMIFMKMKISESIPK